MEISRSTAYYQPREASEEPLSLMGMLDELHLLYPFYDSCRLRGALYDEHMLVVNRKRRWVDNIFIERLWRSV